MSGVEVDVMGVEVGMDGMGCRCIEQLVGWERGRELWYSGGGEDETSSNLIALNNVM